MDDKSHKPLSKTTIIIISGLIVWTLWFGFLLGIGIFCEEVLGFKKEGPDWLINVAVITIFAIGFFLWRLVGSYMNSLWGESNQKPTDDDKQKQ
jgi:hypothetical protein